jgi:hypothetical protein
MQLAAFDWRVQYVVSSSAAAGINAPLLQLSLSVRGARTPKPQPRNPCV